MNHDYGLNHHGSTGQNLADIITTLIAAMTGTGTGTRWQS